jgi:hypothetical protein
MSRPRAASDDGAPGWFILATTFHHVSLGGTYVQHNNAMIFGVKH